MADDTDPFAGLAPKGQASSEVSAAAAPDDPFVGLAPKTQASATEGRTPDALSNSNWHTPVLAAQSLASGLVSTAAIPGQMYNLLDWVQNKLGIGTPTKDASGNSLPGESNPFPSSQTVAGWNDKLGLNTLHPQSTSEDIVSGAAKGIGGAVPFAVLGPEGALMQLSAGAGGGMAAEVAHVLAPGLNWIPVIAGGIGGIVGGGGANYLSNLAALSTAKRAVADTTEALSTATAAKNAAADTANEAKLPGFDAKAQLVDQTAAAVQAHNDAKDAAIAASKTVRDDAINVANAAKAKSESDLNLALTEADTKEQASAAATAAVKAQAAAKVPVATADIKDGLESIAKLHGTSTDLDSAGDLIQPVARNFLTSSLPKAEESVWSPVDSGVGTATPTPIDNFLGFVAKAKAAGGSLGEVIAKFSPNIGRILEKPLGQFAGEAGEDAALNPTIPTWADVRRLRSAIGEGMSNPMVLKDISRQNLEGLYATVTSDLQKTAEGAGFGDAFTNANTTSRELRGFADGPISDIISGPKPVPGKDALPGEAAASLLTQAKTSGESLRLLRSMPDTATIPNELAAVTLRKAFDNPKAWTDLAPRAKAALVPDPGHRAMIETLLADKDRVPGEVKAQLDAADAAHKATVAQLDSDRELAKAVHKNNVRSAGATISAANTAHAADKAAIAASTRIAVAAAKKVQANALGAMSRAKEETETNIYDLGAAQRDAREAAAAAKAKLASFKTPASTHGLNALVGLDLGEHAGDIAGHALGLSGIPYHASALIGAAAPAVLGAIQRLMTNPRNALNAVLGGEAGNATAPNPLTK